MIAIGNGEACPFCKDKKEEDKFINQANNDFLEHIMAEHPKELEKFLFSGDNIGL